jgi:ferric-dicitrate binding protein FerR (iron transport regulator)
LKRRRNIALVLGILVIVLITGIQLFGPSKHSSSLSVLDNPDAVTKRFVLKDGTEVLLGAMSSLQYPSDFGEKERLVYLDGKAQFHVKHDVTRPFRVYEGNLVATVLGTIFRVEKNTEDSELNIKLIQGSLKVELQKTTANINQTLYLKPNEQIIYRQSTGLFIKEPWNSDSSVKIANHLLFKNASFQTVASQIKEVFKITLINQSQKKNWHFTAEFTNAGLREVIDNICLIEGLTSKAEGDSVLLR